ncbi:uncharacterized protein BO80DRAFT_111392 [Aspergillus ibericus CBS 121593]|uniref:Uncharacterized protein n=1 Tax=Aspergillus ibericus CBS 121593 TaxID=1448316 RepID=A0A395GWI4_9EURO|nr:hypothetical protein BO80DRAFT_111392 [Aspergillus ibericus CBS 121593]RAK99941.1 hypothetical protein BO80DRAFT_111392 [Aspergillus ibericus CBS 121593]
MADRREGPTQWAAVQREWFANRENFPCLIQAHWATAALSLRYTPLPPISRCISPVRKGFKHDFQRGREGWKKKNARKKHSFFSNQQVWLLSCQLVSSCSADPSLISPVSGNWEGKRKGGCGLIDSSVLLHRLLPAAIAANHPLLPPTHEVMDRLCPALALKNCPDGAGHLLSPFRDAFLPSVTLSSVNLSQLDGCWSRLDLFLVRPPWTRRWLFHASTEPWFQPNQPPFFPLFFSPASLPHIIIRL